MNVLNFKRIKNNEKCAGGALILCLEFLWIWNIQFFTFENIPKAGYMKKALTIYIACLYTLNEIFHSISKLLTRRTTQISRFRFVFLQQLFSPFVIGFLPVDLEKPIYTSIEGLHFPPFPSRDKNLSKLIHDLSACHPVDCLIVCLFYALDSIERLNLWLTDWSHLTLTCSTSYSSSYSALDSILWTGYWSRTRTVFPWNLRLPWGSGQSTYDRVFHSTSRWANFPRWRSPEFQVFSWLIRTTPLFFYRTLYRW